MIQVILSLKSRIHLLLLIILFGILHLWLLQHILNLSDDVAKIWSFRKQRVDKTQFKYILSWDSPFQVTRKSPFLKYDCAVRNCILTEDRTYMADITQFDAILFYETKVATNVTPHKRTPNQVYIFTSIESAYNHPACELFNDDFFNWTFTYRLDSDIVFPYFAMRDFSGKLVAPSRTPDWKMSSGPLEPSIKSIISGKSKAAAWMVSHCHADSLRDDFLSSLQEYLMQLSLKIDVFGRCSSLDCGSDRKCHELYKKDYYFYMAFENSISEDYVSEKVLHGYFAYTVPIVYGGANYSRFLPPGSYLNAMQLGPEKLAKAIKEAIDNPAVYERFFYYTNLYVFDVGRYGHRYSFPAVNHPLCDLCKALNDKNMTKPKPGIQKFRVWWNGLNGMKWCLSDEYWNETALVNTDIRHMFTF